MSTAKRDGDHCLRARRAPTAVDLYCGCGGLTTGLKQAGFRVLGAVDVDPLAVLTYGANHPEVEIWRVDIRDLDPLEVLSRVKLKQGELDLLAGCPPCQGFSALRTLNGALDVNDPRNDLVDEFARFAAAFRPKAIMLENVPALRNDPRFGRFCHVLSEMGYSAAFRVLDVVNYGVPQHRKRLIYLAGNGFAIPFARPSRRILTVREAIGGLRPRGQSGDAIHDLPEQRSPRVQRLIDHIPKNGGSRKDLPARYQLACHRRTNGFSDVYGRIAWDKPAPTITSGCTNPSKGRFLHPSENRAITVREAALLQGFPPRYRFPDVSSKEALASLIGNALPPPFVARHARRIRSLLGALSWDGRGRYR